MTDVAYGCRTPWKVQSPGTKTPLSPHWMAKVIGMRTYARKMTSTKVFVMVSVPNNENVDVMLASVSRRINKIRFSDLKNSAQ